MYKTIFVLAIVIISVNTCLGLPGSGTQEEPWRIESPADFNEFAADPNYWRDWTRLETDVNLAGQTYTTAVIAPDVGGRRGFQGPAFTGVFDGNGHKIKGLTIDGARSAYLGLFGFIDGGEVRNLGLEGGSVRGYRSVGGIVGENWEATISNCYSTGDVSGDSYVGGLVGRSYYGSVSNCYSTGDVSDVSGGGAVGGLVGGNEYGSVSNCYSTGDISGGRYVGGLVGWNWDGSVSNCYSTGDISGYRYVGGLVGWNEYGSISNCYSTGDVSSNGWCCVGGLVGGNGGSVSNCYSTGDVSGESIVGGLVGSNGFYASVTNCYSSGDVSGDDWVGGLMGGNSGRVSSCYSSGDVSGDDYVGGLVGISWVYGSISNCYSTGDVDGNSVVGGLVGLNIGYGSISNCYSTGDVSGYTCVGGLVGGNYYYGSVSNCFWDTETQSHGVTESIGRNDGTVTNVKGLPTAKMQDIDTYLNAGWDFTTPIWQMCDGPDYPKLWWEKCPIEAEIEIKPNTLNLASKGKWITCHIRLGEDYNVTDIDPNSVVLEDEIFAEQLQINGRVAVAKFNRSEVEDIVEPREEVELAVSGELINGTRFEGADTIRVIDKSNKK